MELRLVLQQNKYAAMLIALQLAVLIILLLIALPLLDESISFWRGITSPSVALSEEDIAMQLEFYARENSQLVCRLDSLRSWLSSTASDETRVAFILAAAKTAELAATSCEIETVTNEDGTVTKRFTLSLEGKYHKYGLFLTDLENSAFSFIVEDVTLRSKGHGSTDLEGRLVVSSRFRKVR